MGGPTFDGQENAIQQYMMNVYGEMFGNPVKFDRRGHLIKTT